MNEWLAGNLLGRVVIKMILRDVGIDMLEIPSGNLIHKVGPHRIRVPPAPKQFWSLVFPVPLHNAHLVKGREITRQPIIKKSWGVGGGGRALTRLKHFASTSLTFSISLPKTVESTDL